MTFENRSNLGRNLNEIGKALGLERHIPSTQGDLGSLYLSSDHFNDAIREFRLALESDWSDHAPPELADELREKLAWCYFWTGAYQEAERVVGSMSETTVRAGTLVLEGRLAMEQANPTGAAEKGREALHVAKTTGVQPWIGPARSLLGIIAQRSGSSEEARNHFEEALFAYRVAEDPDGECRSFIHLGTLSKSECRWEEAFRYLERARQKAGQEGFYYLSGSASLNLGNLRIRLGEHDEALPMIEDGRRVFEEIGYELGVTRALIAEAKIHLVRGSFEAVDNCLKLGKKLCEEERFKRERTFLEIIEGSAAIQRGNRAAGEANLYRAVSLAEEVSPAGDLAVEATLYLAQHLIQSDRLSEGIRLVDGIGEASRAVGDPAQEGWRMRLSAEVDLTKGRVKRAEEKIATSIASFERIGYRQDLAQALLVAGRIAMSPNASHGQSDAVLTHYLRAKRIWEDLSSDRETAMTSIEIARYWVDRQDLDEALIYAYTAKKLLEKVGYSWGVDEARELIRLIEQQFEYEIMGRGDATHLKFSELEGNLEDGLCWLLAEASADTDADKAWIACGTNGAELQVLSSFGLDDDEAEAAVGRLIARDPGFLEAERPLFCTGLTGSYTEDESRSVVILPFSIGGGERGILYVERDSGEDNGWFRLRDVQHLAGATFAIARLVAEDQKTKLHRENVFLREQLENKYPFANIVTEDARMIETLQIASRVANYPITVLIEGETGTGKQLLAQAIHDSGDRADGPFVTVNCASLPEQILESELFGYVKGAFTGALGDRNGLFEEANGGTILLDEIGKAGAHVQRALLHVLDQGMIRPVGSSRHRKVDVRVVCATSNMELKEDIREGRFLKDLYYRINDISLRLPPLRERVSDVRLLADYFLDLCRQKVNRNSVEFHSEIYETLDRYDWPGNVRELEKAVRRAVLLCPGQSIRREHLPDALRPGVNALSDISASSGPSDLKSKVEALETAQIIEALRRNRGNRSKTARELGLSLRGLRNKIQRYNLENIGRE